MITNGVSFGLSDIVTLDTQFTVNSRNFYSTYIYVGSTAGDIVFQNSAGINQWLQAASLGYHPIAAGKILTSGVVNGVSRTTTATGMSYCGSVVY